MGGTRRLLLANQAYVRDKLALDNDYFSKMSGQQTPEFLWIGCSDSRVPAEDLTGAEPGEIFVHRNVANLLLHTDFNALSVLQYAVEVLKVPHIIVCGHYGCGGVKASMGHQPLGLINKWLRNIKDIYNDHQSEFDQIGDENERWNRLVELNVQAQVEHVAQTTFVQKSWLQSQAPVVHGWVYDLNTGLIKELCRMDYQSKVDDIYRYDFSM